MSATATAHPAHIHVGACGTNGPVQYPLNPVIDGKSETVLEFSLDEVLAKLPLYVNVHESASALETIVGCGNIVATADLIKNVEMRKSAGLSIPPEALADALVRNFDITASNFKFTTLANSDITVKKGATVTINLAVANGSHDLVIDEFNARTEQMSAGSSGDVTFVADKVGTFEYYCSVGNHRGMGMVGKLIVVE
jgi:plastocyanin